MPTAIKQRRKRIECNRGGTPKLTKVQRIEIRYRYLVCRERKADLAREFGVTWETIHNLIRGITWSDDLKAPVKSTRRSRLDDLREKLREESDGED